MSEEQVKLDAPYDQSGTESTARFDRADLARGLREYTGRMPAAVPVLKVAARSDMGQVRENNEDKFDFYEPEDPGVLAARGSLYAVADGVGGAQAGQVASELVLKHLLTGYYNSSEPDAHSALRSAITAANDRVFGLARAIPERNNMASTLTATVFLENQVLVAQVGDSRAYLVRNGSIRQVTQDHSLVEEQVRAGVMSREDADNSPFRNVITRSVGGASAVAPDFYTEECRIGDIWILCSDGLSGYVEDGELAEVSQSNSPSESARQFVELANARGGHDNITVMVLSVRDLVACEQMQLSSQSNGFQPDNLALRSPATVPLTPDVARAAGVDMESGAEADPPSRGWRKLFGK